MNTPIEWAKEILCVRNDYEVVELIDAALKEQRLAIARELRKVGEAREGRSGCCDGCVLDEAADIAEYFGETS